MENLAPLLIFVVFIILSLLNKKKPGQGVPPGRSGENQKPQPKPVDLETIFDEFFGEKKQQSPYQDDEQLLDMDDEPVVARELTAIERAFEEKGYEYGSFQSEPKEENVFQQYLNKTNFGENYQFSTGSLDVSSYSGSKGTLGGSDSMEIGGENYFNDTLVDLDGFSPRDAIIYSAIINRKY